MMNPEAMKRMKDMAAVILSCPEERREECYEILKSEAGLSEAEIQHFREYVFYYRLFTDNRFYKAVEKAIGERLYKEFNQ